MSLRKPLVRYDTQSRAQLVPETVSTSMPRRRKTGRRKRSGKIRATKGRPRVVKGRVNVRVAGYLGVQKVAPSKLIPYLPANKLRQAAKKVLVASGTRPSRGGKRTKTKRRGRKGRKGRKKRARKGTRKTRTRRK